MHAYRAVKISSKKGITKDLGAVNNSRMLLELGSFRLNIVPPSSSQAPKECGTKAKGATHL